MPVENGVDKEGPEPDDDMSWVYKPTDRDTAEVKEVCTKMEESKNAKILDDKLSKNFSHPLVGVLDTNHEKTSMPIIFNFERYLITLPGCSEVIPYFSFDHDQEELVLPGKLIRYVVTCPPQFKPEDNVIMISFKTLTAIITVLYLKVEDGESVALVMNAFRKLDYSNNDLSTYKINRYSVRKMGEVSVAVEGPDLPQKPAVEAEKFTKWWCILDDEALQLYETNTKFQPKHIMKFWQEDDREVIETVMVDHDSKQMRVCTKLVTVVFDYSNEPAADDSFIELIRKMKPGPREKFRDAQTLTYYYGDRPKIRDTDETEEWPLDPTPKSTFDPMMPDLTPKSTFQPPKSGEDWDSKLHLSGPSDSAAGAEGPMFPRTDWANAAELLDWEAMAKPPSEELENMFAVAEADMEAMEETGLIPGSSIASGGLDPDSVSHFKKVVDEIQEAIFAQQYDVAMSHARGATNVFKDSKNGVMKKTFNEEDTIVTMCKRLFFHGEDILNAAASAAPSDQ